MLVWVNLAWAGRLKKILCLLIHQPMLKTLLQGISPVTPPRLSFQLVQAIHMFTYERLAWTKLFLPMECCLLQMSLWPPPYAIASISALQFDHCGHRFATAALDGTVCTWQLEVGRRSDVRPAESSHCFNSHASYIL